MKVLIITWKIETGQVFIECKVNEQLRRARYPIEDFMNRTILDYGSSGINETNWEDAVGGKDPKHIIKVEMITSFIEWVFNVQNNGR